VALVLWSLPGLRLLPKARRVAPLFTGSRLARWVRWLAIANGVVALPVLLSYVLGSIALGIWWQLTLPTFTLLLALFFRRTARAGATQAVE
jgi:hypothetical protein